MAAIDPECVEHQYLYVPFPESADIDTVPVGKAIALWVAAQYHVRPTVACPQNSNAASRPELTKQPVAPERGAESAARNLI